MEENSRILKSPRKNPTPRKLVKVHLEADACHTNDKNTHNTERDSHEGPTTTRVSVSKTSKISNAVLGNGQKSSESHRKTCKSNETKIVEEARKHKDGERVGCLSSKTSSLKRKRDDCAVEYESKRIKSNSSAVQNSKSTAPKTDHGSNCKRLLSGADSVQTSDDAISQPKSVSFCPTDHYDVAIDLSRKVSKVKLSADSLAQHVLPIASAESSRLLSVDTSSAVSASSCSHSTITIGSKVSAKDNEVLENATVCLGRFGCNLSEGECNESCIGTPECAKAKDLIENQDNSTVTLGSNVESVDVNTRTTPVASEQIQVLTDELNILNQQSSHISTHLYRHQTPKRKRGFGMRQYSNGLVFQNPSTNGTPFRRWFRRTPSKSSPRVTPKAAFRNTSPFGSRLMFSPTTTKSLTKAKTPSKSSAKRKLYPDTPDDDADKSKLSVVEVDRGQMSLELMESSEDIFDSNPLVLSFDMEPMEMNCVAMESAVVSPSGDALTPEGLKIVEDLEKEGQEEDRKREEEGKGEEEELAEDDEVLLGLDNEIDDLFEEKSKKLHLTARNVRNIIHQVLTDDSVKLLVRNAIEEGALKEQLQAAIFEPMLTRSKLKEVIEKGQIRPPFAVSPVKAENQKSFLDMNFPDEEDDDEYQPSTEEMEHVSDDDSIHSSQTSDFGSPIVNVMSKRKRRIIIEDSASEGDVTPGNTPMGPPSTLPLRSQHLSYRSDNIALRTRSKLPLNDTPLTEIEANFVAPDITPDLYDAGCQEDDWTQFLAGLMLDVPGGDALDDDLNDPEFDLLHALERTEEDPEESRNDKAVRISKKELKELMGALFEEDEDGDVGCNSLELFPLEFQPQSDEPVRAASCSSSSSAVEFYQPGVLLASSSLSLRNNSSGAVTSSVAAFKEQQTESHQENDPSVLSRYPCHVPPLKLNPPLVNALVSELIKLKSSEEIEEEEEEEEEVEQTAGQDDDADLKFTAEELLQLKCQMQMHVQLLAQSFVQSFPQSFVELCKVADFAKQSLEELKELSLNSSVTSSQSYFSAVNLEDAIELTKHSYESKDKNVAAVVADLMSSHFCKKTYSSFGLTYEQMEVFMTNKAFILPQILPEQRLVGFSDDRVRVFYSEAEDNLFAMGLDQFGHLPTKYSLIRQYLLPIKTTTQLLNRFKNLTSRSKSQTSSPPKENPVSFWHKHKRLPEFPRYYCSTNGERLVAPKDQDPSLLPKWFPVFKKIQDIHARHLRLKRWTICGVPGTILSAHGNHFDPKMTFMKSSKERNILPTFPLLSAILQTNPQPLSSSCDLPVMFTFPSTDDLCIPVMMTDSSVTSAGPAVILGDSTDVTGSFVADNTPSGNVYHVVGTLYPSFDSGAVEQTSGCLEVQPAKYESSDATEPLIASLPGQLQNSLAVAAGSSTPVPNEFLKAVVTLGDQVKFYASPQFVEQFAFPTGSDTQDFGGSFSAFAPTATSAHVLSSDIELMNYTTPFSQTYQRALSMPCYRNSFELFPCGAEALENPSTCSSLVEFPVTKVSVDCEGVPLSLSDLSSNFSIGCLDGVSFSSMPDLQSSTSSVCVDTCYSDRLDLGAAAAATVDYGRNTNGLSNEGRRENVSRTTAVVISASKNSSSPSVVLSPSKLISVLPDVPEPVLLLTQGQLKQLGLTVNILSLPTISTSKEHTTCSPSKINPQQSSEDKNIVKNSNSRPNGELLPCCIHGSDSYVCVKDMIRFAFESEVGLPETLIDNSSVDGDVVSTTPFQHNEALCCNYCTGKMTVKKDRLNEDEHQPKQTNSNYHLQFHETNNLSTLPRINSQALMELKFSVDGVTDKSNTMVDCLNKSKSLGQGQAEHTSDENAFVNHSEVSMIDTLKCGCDHLPDPMVKSESNENLSMCTPVKYVAVSSSIGRSRQQYLVHCDRDKGNCSMTSAATGVSSSSPHRRVWHHASSARTSKGSFRNKAKMFGQQSPMRFILPNPNPPPSPLETEALASVIKPSVNDVLAIPKRPKRLQAIAPKPFQARSLSLKNVSVGLTGGRKAQKRRRQAEESSPNVRMILPKPDSKTAVTQFLTELSSVQSLGKQKRRLDKRCEDLGMRSNMETCFIDPELVESNGKEKDETSTVADVSFDVDSQTEEENDEEQHLAELLEASTTIRCAQKGSRSHLEKINKAEQRKEMALALLTPDLLANHQSREDRELMLAQAYHSKVHKTLENDREVYEKFLQLFAEFDQNMKSIAELHGEAEALLSNYPELIADFAAFLSPEQALECRCFLPNYKQIRARTFLCKLETYFHKHPAHFLKCLKVFKEWHEGTFGNDELYRSVLPLIRNSPHLVEEFSMFFEDKRPPQSRFSQYEEVTIGESDDENQAYEDYEKVDIPSVERNYGTINCPCRCHVNGAERFMKKLHHCTSCGLKVIKGQLYLQTSDRFLRPATVTYHHRNGRSSEAPEDESTGRKMFKSCKAASPKRRRPCSKKSSGCLAKDKSPHQTVMEPDSTSMLSPVAVEDPAMDNGCSAAATDAQAITGLRSHPDRVCPTQTFLGQTTETDSVKLCSSIDAARDAESPMATQSPAVSTDERSVGHPMDDDSVESGAMSGPMLLGDNGVLVSDANVVGCDSDEAVFEAESLGLSERGIDSNGVQSSARSGIGSRLANVLSNVGTPYDQCSIFPTMCSELFNVDSCNRRETVFDQSASLNESGKSEHSSAVRGTPAALPPDVVLLEDTLPSWSPAANDGWSIEEDRLILQTCQGARVQRKAFQTIVETLRHRTLQQVSERFTHLMEIFNQLTNDNISDDSATDDDDDDDDDEDDDDNDDDSCNRASASDENVDEFSA